MKLLTIHGTCVEVKQKAVLICGKPGVGKSSLALQLIDRGGLLIADDQTTLIFENGHVMAQCPPALKGLMEVRGVGICSFPYQEKAPLGLCVDLCEEAFLERLPTSLFREYHGVSVPLLKLQRHDHLAAIKIELKVGYKDASDLS